VQRTQAHLHLGDDGVVDLLHLAVKPIQHLGQFDGGDGGGELARADEVLLVGAGIHAVRVLGNRHIGCQRGLGVLVGFACAIHHGNLRSANGLELASLNSFFDAGDVEEQAGVAFGRHHVFIMRAHFRVVLVGGSELAVIRRGDQVAVAVNHHLPTHFHRLRVHAREQRTVLGGIFDSSVRQGNRELTTAKHAGGVVDGRVHRVALVRENAVKTLHIGQLGNLVANEVVQTDTGDTGVDLVVDPGVAAVVVAVLIGGVRVVGVAHGIAQGTIGLGAHDLLGFVGNPPADQRVRHETGDTQDFATGRQAQHAHVAGVAAAPESVVGVEFTGLEVDAGAAVSCSSRCRSGCWRGGCCGWGRCRLVVAGCDSCGQSSQSGGVDKPSTAHADGFNLWIRFLIAHDDLSWLRCVEKKGGPRAGGGSAMEE